MENKIKELVDRYVEYVTSDIDRHVTAEKYKFDALHHFQSIFDWDSIELAENLKAALAKVDNLAVGAGYYPVASINEIARNSPEELRSALRLLFTEEKPVTERIQQFQNITSPLSQKYSVKTVSFPYNMDLRFISLLLSLRYPNQHLYFKPAQVDSVYTKIYGQKTGTRAIDPTRVSKATELARNILAALNQRPEFESITAAMGDGDRNNLWYAQDVMWHAATSANPTNSPLEGLKAKIRKYMADNPNYAQALWTTEHDITQAINEFNEKFSIESLRSLSDESILRVVPFNADSDKDTLSYYLEHHNVLRNYGGIGGGSAGKMGFYQGNDGQWKDYKNQLVTKDEVLQRRKRDIELLSEGSKYLEVGDFNGLRRFRSNLTDKYDVWFYGLIWVRKYYALIFQDKFLQIYGTAFVKGLESISGVKDIDGSEDGDAVNWYEKTQYISSVAKELGISNYVLSNILWELIKAMKDSLNSSSLEKETDMNQGSTAKNTILYGPPGTGKTYSVNEYKQRLLGDQSASENTGIIDGINSWHDAILKAYVNNQYQPMSVSEIVSSDVMVVFAKTRKSKAPYGTISTQILNRSTPESSIMVYRSGVPAFNKVGVGRWELTDDGRVEAEELQSYIDQASKPKKEIDSFFTFITFHQSYSYEEFIEGIRASTDNGQIQYEVRDGIFKAFCERAKNDPDNNYLFVIDEINRGNISKIFGELITLIESSKRLGAKEELTVTLPYSGDTFGVPHNVYIIGTMNTADRSIALLDIALRRRFDFVEIMPDESLVPSDVSGVNLQKLLKAINTKIVDKIDRNHQVGHSYFMGISTDEELRMAWYQRVVPLLQEYFYDDNEDLASILNGFIRNNEVMQLENEAFKDSLIGIYEETDYTDNRIQL